MATVRGSGVGDRAGGARRNSHARRTPVERTKKDRGQRRGERGVAVAKFRSRRLAIDITVTIVTGVAPPGSACLLLFSEGGEPSSAKGKGQAKCGPPQHNGRLRRGSTPILLEGRNVFRTLRDAKGRRTNAENCLAPPRSLGGSLGALGHGNRCARVGRREGSVVRQARAERPSRGLASRP